MTWYVYCASIPIFNPINAFITNYIYLLFICFFVRTLKFSRSKFQLYNTELSTTVTMLYINSSNLIHLITENLYTFLTGDFGHLLPLAQLKCSQICVSVRHYSIHFSSFSISFTGIRPEGSLAFPLILVPISSQAFPVPNLLHIWFCLLRELEWTQVLSGNNVGLWGLSHLPFSWQKDLILSGIKSRDSTWHKLVAQLLKISPMMVWKIDSVVGKHLQCNDSDNWKLLREQHLQRQQRGNIFSQ